MSPRTKHPIVYTGSQVVFPGNFYPSITKPLACVLVPGDADQHHPYGVLATPSKRDSIMGLMAGARVVLTSVKQNTATGSLLELTSLNTPTPTLKLAKTLVLKIAPNLAGFERSHAESIKHLADIASLSFFVAPYLTLSNDEKIKLLQETSPTRMGQQLLHWLRREQKISRLAHKLEREVQGELHESERRRYLVDQMVAIKKELGELDGIDMDPVEDLQKQLKKSMLPKEVYSIAEKELSRLSLMTDSTPEFLISAQYLQTIFELPWNTPVNSKPPSLQKASQMLDQHHFGLEKPKSSLLELLAVLLKTGSLNGKSILLHGPPGVGKTSLATAMSEAIGRPLVKISLGGIKDEAEIRGHRRTYVGALPGKIIHAMKQSGVSNPILLLDEIDKIDTQSSTAVASALLEVLDPAQNKNFQDHYLAFSFDLSGVMFIATANTTDDMMPALLDRFLTIEVPSYSDQEKISIAEKYLIPRIRKAHKLPSQSFRWERKSLLSLMQNYTRESGVRNLEREITRIAHKIVLKEFSSKKKSHLTITPERIQKFLGPPTFIEEPRDHQLPPGVVIGLAYTAIGGDIMYVEVTRVPAKIHRLILTGHQGKVMQESAQTAMTYLFSQSHAWNLHLHPDDAGEFHIHLPDGGTPKDGPSAGVGIFLALLSAVTQKSVPASFAFTGEVSLRGQVLPVGGIREKILAAHRYGKTTVIIPEANRADLGHLPKEVLKAIRIQTISQMEDLKKISTN